MKKAKEESLKDGVWVSGSERRSTGGGSSEGWGETASSLLVIFNINLSERDAQEAVGIGTRSPAELWAGDEDLNLQQRNQSLWEG